MRNKNRKTQQGIATLPTVGALMIFILAVSLLISTLSVNESFGSQNLARATEALLYAEAGARDALMRIARDKNYSGTYTIEFAPGGCADNTGCATVTVSAGTGAAGNPKVITSDSKMVENTRGVTVNVLFDTALRGLIATTTWTF